MGGNERNNSDNSQRFSINGTIVKVAIWIVGVAFGAGMIWGATEVKIASLQERYAQSDNMMKDRICNIEERLARIDATLIEIERQIGKIEGGVNYLTEERKLYHNNNWKGNRNAR